MDKLLNYFNGNELAAQVWKSKYAAPGEETPDDMHRRMARELSRVLLKTDSFYTEEVVYNLLKDFKYIVPQGSVMSTLGVDGKIASLSNCFVSDSPSDSYGGIVYVDEVLAQLMKRRGGVGVDISTLRPRGVKVKNAAGTSTGAASFMERYSTTTREVAQCIEDNQRVLTRLGLAPIKDIVPGDEVWTRVGWVLVLDTVNNEKQMFKVTTKYGHTLLCSEDHVLHMKGAIGSEEKPLRDIKVGDKVSILLGQVVDKELLPLAHNFERVSSPVRNKFGSYGERVHNAYKNVVVPPELNEDLAYLIGYSYGNGHVGTTSKGASSLRVSVPDDRPKIMDTIMSIVVEQFGHSPSVSKGDGACKSVTIGTSEICSFLNENGLLKSKAGGLRIPTKIWESGSSVQMAFLDGYFDADGYASGRKKGYVYSTISLSMAQDIQTMLLVNGIYSKIHSEDRTKLGWSTLYTISVTGRLSQEALLSKSRSTKVLECGWVSTRDYNISPYSPKELGIKGQYKFVNSSCKNMSLHSLDLCSEYEGAMITVDEVESIVPTEVAPCRDLVLEAEHLFWCEGFYVHNSGRRGALMETIYICHPDSREFIGMKQDRTKVTGANISVMITDDFMQRASEDKDYIQVWPIDYKLTEDETARMELEPFDTLVDLGGKYAKRVRAKELYDYIVHNAWDNAEPGQIFIDRMHNYAPDGNYPMYKVLTTNPCCFAESCRVDVVTKSGIKALREVTAEDEVWLEGEKKFAPTSGYFQVGVHPVYKVTFSNGETLVITGNHKLAKIRPNRVGTKMDKTDFELIELRDLAVGDEVRVHLHPSEVFGDLGSYEDGLILGWLSGDGCLSYKNEGDNFATMYLDFWPNDDSAAQVVESAVRSIGLTNKVLTSKNNGNNVKRIHSTRLTQYYTEKFESNIWKWRKGRNPILYQMSREFVRGYLSSYFSADGTVHTSYEKSNFAIQLGSIERERLEQVQMLLMQFGIKSYIGVAKEEGNFRGLGDYKTKKLYRLSITGVEHLMRFHKEIGFISEWKSSKLGDLADHDHRYTKSSTYTKIRSIEPVGEEMVGCIEVPGYNYFTANSIISGNSEIGMGAWDACRLVAINLFSYVSDPFTENASFDYDMFDAHCYHLQMIGDAIVDLELEHIDRILEHIKGSPEPDFIKSREIGLWENIKRVAGAGRRTGCGITALGDTLAALGLKYDSYDAFEVVGDIMKSKLKAELAASIRLSKEYGPFQGYDPNVEESNLFTDMLKEEAPQLYQEMRVHGRRNVSWSTIAPTGSLSILTQTSSGLEPMFLPFYTRRRKINPSDKFNRVDFVDQNGDKWMEYAVLEPKFKMWMEMQGVEDTSVLTTDEAQAWFEKSPWYGSCANDIDWERRVDMQSVCQKYISHSISSTINLPNSATKEDVERIYVRAWEKGLKGVTVYRDGCRTGVLVSNTAKQESFSQHSAPKRPKTLPAEVHHTTSTGDPYTVVVGLMDGKPYEVFVRSGRIGEKGDGEILKSGKGQYILFQNPQDFLLTDENDTPEQVLTLTRMISTALRHGAEIKFVAQQLRKEKGSIVGFAASLARVLSKYVGVEVSSEVCPECGADGLVREEGCLKCKSCGYSKCS